MVKLVVSKVGHIRPFLSKEGAMLKQDCRMCKIVGTIAVIGALNMGVIGITGNNVIEGITGVGTGITKAI